MRALMRRVVVESPYAAPTDAGVERNCVYARAAVMDCLLRGEAPFASHLLYTQAGMLDDRDPVQRALGIEAGLQFVRDADLSAVYMDLGGSSGMLVGVVRACEDGRPVTFRSLDAFRTPAFPGHVEAFLLALKAEEQAARHLGLRQRLEICRRTLEALSQAGGTTAAA